LIYVINENVYVTDEDEKPKPPEEVGFSQTKKKPKQDFESKARVIRQLLADEHDDMSIEAQLARAQKIQAVAKRKKYLVPENEVNFLQDLFMPPILKWDPAYKSTVNSLPIPFYCWVDEPPEMNDYMLLGLRKQGKQTKPGEPLTCWDDLLLEYLKKKKSECGNDVERD
jgi:hypothetical protein